MGEVLLRPATREGGFRSEYVEGERHNLVEQLRAQKNDKRQYAMLRLVQEMCAEEPFGVDRLGDEAHAAAVTAPALWARYQSLLAESPVEVYYCGSAEPEQVRAEILRRALAGLPGRGVARAWSAPYVAGCQPGARPGWWRRRWT